MILHYDINDGVFTWLRHSDIELVGTVAGSINDQGYVQIVLDGISYKAHRLVWLYLHGEFPKDIIDHIDGDKGNNRRENLRECSYSENQANRGLNKNNTSGYKGVSFCIPTGKWRALVYFRGTRISCGRFDSVIDAAKAYDRKALEVFGDFASVWYIHSPTEQQISSMNHRHNGWLLPTLIVRVKAFWAQQTQHHPPQLYFLRFRLHTGFTSSHGPMNQLILRHRVRYMGDCKVHTPAMLCL